METSKLKARVRVFQRDKGEKEEKARRNKDEKDIGKSA